VIKIIPSALPSICLEENLNLIKPFRIVNLASVLKPELQTIRRSIGLMHPCFRHSIEEN
jgi:hypothetical protein